MPRELASRFRHAPRVRRRSVSLRTSHSLVDWQMATLVRRSPSQLLRREGRGNGRNPCWAPSQHTLMSSIGEHHDRLEAFRQVRQFEWRSGTFCSPCGWQAQNRNAILRAWQSQSLIITNHVLSRFYNSTFIRSYKFIPSRAYVPNDASRIAWETWQFGCVVVLSPIQMRSLICHFGGRGKDAVSKCILHVPLSIDPSPLPLQSTCKISTRSQADLLRTEHRLKRFDTTYFIALQGCTHQNSE